MWAGVAVLGLLALTLVRRPTPEAPPVVADAKRAEAPRIALAPSPPPTAVPAPRVVERQGPTLIEKLLADKFGTPLPTPTPPQAAPPARQPEQQMLAAAPKPVPPPLAPKVAVEPPVEKKPAVIVTGPAPLTSRLTARATTPPAVGPEPAPAKPQVAAKPEPAAPKPQATVRAEPAPRAPVEVTERPVQARSVEVARVETVEPVERAERAVAVPTQPVVVASVPRAEPANTASAEAAPTDVERIAAVRTPPPSPPGPSHDAVRVLLDRYAAAWRGHDVDTLRAIGQVTNDGQASALRAYFANVGDLEVEVRVLDIRSNGDRATVRFTRRDRFRDPAGREIAKESPPIEKNIVTTPQGLRFAPAS
jgi:hypothetical protein